MAWHIHGADSADSSSSRRSRSLILTGRGADQLASARRVVS